MTQTPRIGIGGLADLSGSLFSRTHDLSALHHSLGLHAGSLEQFVGFAASLRHELLTFLDHPARLAHLLGQPVQRLFEELDDLVTVDARRRGQRHRGCRRDDVDRSTEQGFGVADVAVRAAHERIGVVEFLLLFEPIVAVFVRHFRSQDRPQKTSSRGCTRDNWAATGGGTRAETSPP